METKTKEISKLIAQAWGNPAFADELINNPIEVLKSYGIEHDSDTEVIVLQETANKKFIVIPPAPDENLFEEVLESGTIIAYCKCQCQCIPPAGCCRCHSGPDK